VEQEAIKNEYNLTFVVINAGQGSKVLKEAKELGVSGGTIFLGKGTVKSHILELLGLEEIKKEIVLLVSDAELEEKIHKGLSKKFHLDRPNHGIAFSAPLKQVLSSRSSKLEVREINRGGQGNMRYEAIFTVVDLGLGQDVVDAATTAGSRGATIIHGRGSGIHEHSMFFSMNIEPEKEIVMILIETEKVENVIEAIKDKINIDEPGKGILFSIDVNRTTGLFQQK